MSSYYMRYILREHDAILGIVDEALFRPAKHRLWKLTAIMVENLPGQRLTDLGYFGTQYTPD